MLKRAALCLALVLFPAYSQCVADGAAKAALDEAAKIPAEKKADRVAVVERALQADPLNYFLLDRLFSLNKTENARDAMLERLAALHQKHPDSPAVAAVYADALWSTDPTGAAALIESIKKAHLEFPHSHLKLMKVVAGNTPENRRRLAEEAEAYLKACPAPDGTLAFRVLVSSGTTEQIARHAGLLRKRLEGEKQPDSDQQTILWDLEFKAVPPAEHGAVRERIRRDLARREASLDPSKLESLELFHAGYSGWATKRRATASTTGFSGITPLRAWRRS